MTPQFVRRADMPAADVEKQKEIFRGQMDEEEAQTRQEAPGRGASRRSSTASIDKWLAEVCLDEQPRSISDEDKTIGAARGGALAKIGEKIAVRRFVRYELGEGIEKKKADFAAEVAETPVKGN